MPQSSHKILVVRNDKLGDFVLSFPSLRLLKQALPDHELHVLVPAYTQPIAEMNPDIDHVVLDPGPEHGWQGLRRLIGQLRRFQYEAVITLYSTTRIGLACWLSRIPVRVAPATKVAQVFYNRRVVQRRSRSEKPEYIYNCELTRSYLQQIANNTDIRPQGPYINIPETLRTECHQAFITQYGIPSNHQLVFIHPGSGGSAVNLSPEQYARLANMITCPSPCTFVISCAPAEESSAQDLSRHLSVPHVVYVSNAGLKAFVEHINLAGLFISGSTGPLHVAGALNRPTAGFYPNRRSATSLRWQTLSDSGRRLEFSPPETADTEDMSLVDINAAASKISELLEHLYKQL